MSKIIEEYKFIVEGRPRPKERPRISVGKIKILAISIYNIFMRKQRISFNDFFREFSKEMKTFVYTPKNTQDYENLVGYTALSALKNKRILDNMVNIELKLYFADKRVGDVDNYTKSVLDGLSPIMDNDKQVKKSIVEKFISIDENNTKITKQNERVEIIIQVLDLPIYYTNKK